MQVEPACYKTPLPPHLQRRPAVRRQPAAPQRRGGGRLAALPQAALCRHWPQRWGRLHGAAEKSRSVCARPLLGTDGGRQGGLTRVMDSRAHTNTTEQSFSAIDSRCRTTYDCSSSPCHRDPRTARAAAGPASAPEASSSGVLPSFAALSAAAPASKSRSITPRWPAAAA